MSPASKLFYFREKILFTWDKNVLYFYLTPKKRSEFHEFHVGWFLFSNFWKVYWAPCRIVPLGEKTQFSKSWVNLLWFRGGAISEWRVVPVFHWMPWSEVMCAFCAVPHPLLTILFCPTQWNFMAHCNFSFFSRSAYNNLLFRCKMFFM